MNGTFYGIGVGPGDPELLTFKAARLIRETPVLALPVSGSGDSAVQAIAGTLIDPARVLPLDMPMTTDPERLTKSHDQAFALIREKLEAGLDVAFLTLGDPSLYSTCTPLLQRARQHGYRCEVVPGIPSFCAVAARIGWPLAERDETLVVHPVPYHGEVPRGNVVLMKVGRHLPRVLAQLESQGRLGNTVLVERCGMDGERVVLSPAAGETSETYFSMMIIKEEHS